MSFDRTPLMRRLGGAVPEEELELFDSLGVLVKNTQSVTTLAKNAGPMN